MRRILSIACLTLALGATAARAAIQPGEYGPPFTKTHVDGGLVSSSDYAGKVVVLFLLGAG